MILSIVRSWYCESADVDSAIVGILSNQRLLLIILRASCQVASKIINRSRWLESIPTMALSASADSQYQLRRNQQQGNLCTFEVAAHLLGQLGEQNNQQKMLTFFAHYLALFQAEKSGHALKQSPS